MDLRPLVLAALLLSAPLPALAQTDPHHQMMMQRQMMPEGMPPAAGTQP